jgi:2,3-bisphosphoglycerate-dependent phosphoglycerate mutase
VGAAKQWVDPPRPVVASFEATGWRLQLYGEAIPVEQQRGWRHFAVEQRLLALGGHGSGSAVLALRRRGMKAEPAFAAALEWSGDPYLALLDLTERDDKVLISLLLARGFASMRQRRNRNAHIHGHRAIYLIRHCQAEGQGPSASLTDKGYRQAAALANLLVTEGISKIVSSPYKRAVDSATYLATKLTLAIQTDVRLIERILSDPPVATWRDHLRTAFENPDLALPGGESGNEAMARGRAAVDAAVSSTTGNVAIVTHGNLLTLILHSFTGRGDFKVWEKLTTPDVFLVQASGTAARMWSDDLAY